MRPEKINRILGPMPWTDAIQLDVYMMELEQEHGDLVKEVFYHAYKAGFDHGLVCDPFDVKKLNEISSSIRMFDHQLDHYIKEAAEKYINEKAQEDKP